MAYMSYSFFYNLYMNQGKTLKTYNKYKLMDLLYMLTVVL